MAEQFTKHDVPFVFASIENGEHGLGDVDPETVERTYDEVLEFVNKHMQPQGSE